jgi:hypothetical protein
MEQWIKLRVNLETDCRVAVIAERLKQHPTRILGCLCFLWFRGDTHTETGFLPGFTRELLDKQTGLKGFSKELEQCNWISFNDKGAQILEFEKHNGTSAKARAKDSKRKDLTRNMTYGQRMKEIHGV